MKNAIGKYGVGLGLALIAGFGADAVFARPTFHDVFGDHAVLQRDKPVRLWGLANPLETVSVRLGEHSVDVSADKDGNWKAELPATTAGGPYSLSVTDNAGEATALNDIMVGDVFLCSGQSNMEMQVKAAMNANNEIRRADNKTIRLYNVERASAPRALTQFATKGAWKSATTENLGDFSAVCYYFARELQPQINVPIGLISASWGRPELKQLNGVVWFRKSFTLTAEQAKLGSALHLGGIDEIDMTWVNGKPLGQTFGWGDARKYILPKATLRAGQNDIVTNVYSGRDAGGM